MRRASPFIFLAAAFAFTSLPVKAGAAVCSEIGNSAVASNSLDAIDGLLMWQKVDLPATLALQAINVYISAGSGSWRAAIYRDGPNKPGQLIVQSAALTAAAPVWNRAPLASPALEPGAYWLGLQVSSPSLAGRYRGNGGTVAFAEAPFGAFPLNAPPVSRDSYLVSAYGEFCVPPPSPTPTESPTASATPTETPTATISPTHSITPTFTVSPTVSSTFTASPTPSFLKAPGAQVLAGPVPARVGERVCLGFAATAISVRGTLYNSAGQRVAVCDWRDDPRPCLQTQGLAPGVYVLQGKAETTAGENAFKLKMILIL
jgi:hypothetical protein